MKPKTIVAILEALGAAVFGAAVLAVILFAKGYQYDSGSNNIVKKGVIYFKGLGNANAQPVVLLDGEKADASFPGSFRAMPGPHDLEISAKGYLPWKKRIVVPEEDLLIFPEIRLFPAVGTAEEAMFFANMFEPISKMKLQSSSEKGVLFTNDAMHYGKFQHLKPDKKFRISELAFKTGYLKLLAVSDAEFLGLSAKKKLFFYNASSKILIEENFAAVDLKQADGDAVFAMDGRGRVFKIEIGDSIKIKPFLAIPEQTETFEKISSSNGKFLFLIRLKGNTIGLITDNSGKILFQEKGIDAAYMEENKLYYSRGSDFFEENILEGKLVAKYQMEAPAAWFSRIGETFHFLFLTKGLQLKFCDEDAQNCRNLIKPDYRFIEASEDKNIFFIFKNGWLTAFDFEEKSLLPRFLKDLVSAVF